MNITSDSYFCIGTQHQTSGLPCQDYAYDGVMQNNVHYAIVADGCSASKDSDMGSRMLTHWFRLMLEEGDIFPADFSSYGVRDQQELIQSFKNQFEGEAYPLQEESLDATIVAAFIHKAFNKGYIFFAGDGGFCIKHKSGRLSSFLLTSPSSMPPYFSYHRDAGRKKNYINHIRAIGANGFMGVYLYNYERKEIVFTHQIHMVQMLEQGGFVFPFDPEDVDTVAVFTDGVASFGPKKDFGETMETFMDIKTSPGFFVVRTCIGNLKRMAKAGVTHYDDFSMAALKFHDENTSESGEQASDTIAGQ